MEFQQPDSRFRSNSIHSVGSHRSITSGASASAHALRTGIVDLTESPVEASAGESSSSDESTGGKIQINNIEKKGQMSQHSHKAIHVLRKEAASARVQPLTTHTQPAKLVGFSELSKEQSLATRKLVLGGGPKPPKLSEEADAVSRWKDRMWPTRAIVSFCRIVTRCRPPAVAPGKPVGNSRGGRGGEALHLTPHWMRDDLATIPSSFASASLHCSILFLLAVEESREASVQSLAREDLAAQTFSVRLGG